MCFKYDKKNTPPLLFLQQKPWKNEEIPQEFINTIQEADF
jgi:hypothetical protein